MKSPLHRFMAFFHQIKKEKLAWQTANQDEINTLVRSRSLAKAALYAELKLRNTHLEHDISALKTRQTAELTMLKTRCETDIKDYRQYLESLEQLKTLTKASFAHLPGAIALTIHHHAKSLLNRMWECSDTDDKIKLEAELIHFMTTVHIEAEQCRQYSTANRLPKNTLKLIGLDEANSASSN